MEAFALIALLILLVVILAVEGQPPTNANHAGLRFEVEGEEDPPGSGGGASLSLPLEEVRAG